MIVNNLIYYLFINICGSSPQLWSWGVQGIIEVVITFASHLIHIYILLGRNLLAFSSAWLLFDFDVFLYILRSYVYVVLNFQQFAYFSWIFAPSFPPFLVVSYIFQWPRSDPISNRISELFQLYICAFEINDDNCNLNFAWILFKSICREF